MKGKKTGGRKKGSKNKRTIELEKAKGGIVPLDYMLEVMRDQTKDTEIRLDAAKSAAPYIHAKRAPENKNGEPLKGIYRIDAFDPRNPEKPRLVNGADRNEQDA